MTLALGLLLASTVIGTFSPALLRPLTTPRVRPRVALAGWVGALLMLLVTAAASAVLLVLPRSSDVDGLVGMAHSCINVVRGGHVVWDNVVRMVAASVLVGLLVWAAVVFTRWVRRHRRWRDHHLGLLRTVCRGEKSVLWLEQSTAVAYSVGGRRGTIVATSGLRRLRPSEQAAVLEHERAHLGGAHHLLVLGAEALGAALPFVPLCRQAPGHVRVLVELSADASAARRCGPGPVRAALLAMSSGGAPDAALAMSRDAVEVRLTWLDGMRRHRRAGWDYTWATLLTVLPTVASVAFAVVAVMLYCLAVAGGVSL